MTIYLAHSASYNFVEELYEPIRQSELSKQHTFIFPHEGEVVDSKESLAKCDLVIAEVSLSSTGLGIELGWANDLKKNIVCLYKKKELNHPDPSSLFAKHSFHTPPTLN